MNYRMIKRTLGWILLFEALFFVVPVITAICFREWRELWHILLAMSACGVLGWICAFVGKVENKSLYAKEGIVIVASSWIVISLFGALPFCTSGWIPNYIDALFETVSGFTTTGASILDGATIDKFPKCLLMWRGFTHWVGGMGVLVFLMAFLNLSGGRNINLLKAESPGPSVSKLVPKVRSTAGILYIIYAALTVLMFVMLVLGGDPKMDVFDSVTTAFATAGTGGFTNHSDGFSGYTSYSQIVVTVFMVLFSINFASYFFILRGRFKEAFNTEVRVFLGIVVAAILLITINLQLTSGYTYTTGEALKHSAFSVASLISTTGFATEDFNLWPAFAKTILMLVMFVGACAGSTGGGIKVSRVVILFKGATHEMKRMLHPNQVKKISMDKKVVEHEVVRGVNAYIGAYILIFILSLLLVSFDCADLVTDFTAVSATFNNIGPGLGLVGPSGNFAFYSWWTKLVFIFDMLAGRLEIFPMLLLFAPATWRK
ncbi:MAG: TrkH family potassium uptake protein [Clostridia bacterium]|nr:TrkH family potassium uptake protein [Clostridia bacterium]